MALYTNHTRHSAIVTILIKEVGDPNSALKIGSPDNLTAHVAGKGVHDFLVHPGMSVEMQEGTLADVLGARSDC